MSINKAYSVEFKFHCDSINIEEDEEQIEYLRKI